MKEDDDAVEALDIVNVCKAFMIVAIESLNVNKENFTQTKLTSYFHV